MDVKDIAAYYDYTTPFYKVFWHGNTNGIHYGLWNSQTTKLSDAILNMNEALASMLELRPGMKVLDAGCGVGGSSIWLTKRYGVQVTGITISPVQKNKAERNARRAGVRDSVHFDLKDYTATGFPDNTFDVVWGLESVCYAPQKIAFLQEAYRVLRPSGQLIVADGFLKREPKDEYEKRVYQTFLKGFILQNLSQTDAFEAGMREVGFHDITQVDVNDRIQRTCLEMQKIGERWLPFTMMMRSFRVIPQFMVDHAKTTIAQRAFFETCGTYAFFYGRK